MLSSLGGVGARGEASFDNPRPHPSAVLRDPRWISRLSALVLCEAQSQNPGILGGAFFYPVAQFLEQV